MSNTETGTLGLVEDAAQEVSSTTGSHTEFNVSDGRDFSGARRKSCGSDETSQAIDILALWIVEDINAVAKSFHIETMVILNAVLDRVQSEAPPLGRRSAKTGRQRANAKCG